MSLFKCISNQLKTNNSIPVNHDNCLENLIGKQTSSNYQCNLIVN